MRTGIAGQTIRQRKEGNGKNILQQAANRLVGAASLNEDDREDGRRAMNDRSQASSKHVAITPRCWPDAIDPPVLVIKCCQKIPYAEP